MDFNGTCVISRPSAGVGPEPNGALEVVASDVACRFWLLRGGETGGPFDVGVGRWRGALPYGTDVRRVDVIDVGGVRYEVEDVDPDPAGRGDHVAVTCKVIS